MNYLVACDMLFPDRPGGMARVAWDIALLMRDRGHSVGFLAMREHARPDAPEVETIDGVRVARYTRPRLHALHPARLTETARAAESAARQVFGGEPWDILHGHTPITADGALRALPDVARRVYTMHSPTVLEQRINWATQGVAGRVKLLLGQGALARQERRVLEACQQIQTLSEFTRDRIEELYGMGRKVRVIPHWRRPGMHRSVPREDAKRRLGWPTDRPALFTVRIHGPRYGIDDAIRAAAPLLTAGKAFFAVGGDGPLRPKFERIAAELGCGDGIRFTGRLSDADLALAYQATDLFLLPTRALECFGLITIEALSYGCPVLSTDAAAIPETMRPVLPDFIVPAGDVGAMRSRIEDFVAGRLRPPGEEVLTRYVADRFDVAAVTPEIADLLESSAARRLEPSRA